MRPTIRNSGALLLAFAMASSGCNSSKDSSSASTAPGATQGGGATVRHTALKSPRAEHTATRTPFGVVVTGGEAAGVVLDSIELYANGAWIAGGKMTNPRKGHTATLLPSGKVLIAGGQKDAQGSQLLSSLEIYDPATKTTSAAGDMSKPRSGHVAVSFRAANLDFVLFAGGASVNGSDASAELYDVVNNRIIPVAQPMLSDRVGAQGMLLSSGKILIQGGIAGLSAQGIANMRPAGAELFDPATQTFARAGLLGIDRFNAALSLTDSGEVVVLGGNSQARVEDTLEAYDAASNSWSNVKATLGLAREDLGATALPTGGILLTGGYDGAALSGAVELYTPRPRAIAGNVTQLAPLQLARRGHTATLLDNGNVLVVGGVGVAGVLASAEEYDASAAPGTPSAATPSMPSTPVTPTQPTNPGTPVTPPEVLAIYPSIGKPGDIITIAGRNFAPKRQDNQVIFGGNVYGRVLFEVKVQNLPFLGSVQTLIVEVPTGAQTGNMVVVSNGVAGSPRTFTIDMQSGGDPKVLYTLPRRQEPGKIVTLFGNNFARTASDNQVTFSGVPARLIGGITTQSVPFLGNVSVMLVEVPANAVTGNIVVTAYGKVSAGYYFEVEGTQPNTGSTGSTTGSTGTTTGGSSATAPVLYSENFEGSAINMSEQGKVWSVLSAGGNGPATAASGSWFAGTRGYGANAHGYLILPEIDLSNVSTATLEFNQFFDTDGVDAGRILVSDDGGMTWYVVRPNGGYSSTSIFQPGEGFTGSSNGWLSTTVNLAGFVGGRVTIVFDFAADGVDQRAGWFVDDIKVSGQ